MSTAAVSEKLVTRLTNGLHIEGASAGPLKSFMEKTFQEYVGMVQNHAHRDPAAEIEKGNAFFSAAKEAGLEEGAAALLVEQLALLARKYVIIAASNIPKADQIQALFFPQASFEAQKLAMYKPIPLPKEVTDLAAAEQPIHRQADDREKHKQSIADACDEIADAITMRYGPENQGARAEFRQIVHGAASGYMVCYEEKEGRQVQVGAVRKCAGIVKDVANIVIARDQDTPLDDAAMEVGETTKARLRTLRDDPEFADRVVGALLRATGEEYRSLTGSRVTLNVSQISRLRRMDEERMSRM